MSVRVLIVAGIDGETHRRRKSLCSEEEEDWERKNRREWDPRTREKIVGDFIVFRYESGKDSVLEVNKEAYNSCNTTNPLANYTDGETKVKLDRSGPFYFISGANGHCEKGQKLSLVVISPRHNIISPAPSPVEFEDGPALAPAPTSGSVRHGGGLYVVLGLVLGLLAWF